MDGTPRMRERPIADLVDGLKQVGGTRHRTLTPSMLPAIARGGGGGWRVRKGWSPTLPLRVRASARELNCCRLVKLTGMDLIAGNKAHLRAIRPSVGRLARDS